MGWVVLGIEENVGGGVGFDGELLDLWGKWRAERNFETMKKMILGLGLVALLLGACTGDPEEGLAQVTTNGVLSVTETTFESGGTVVSDGGNGVIKRGICWATTAEPTVGGPNKTEDGVGLGVFRSKLTGLTPNTKYYYRAYATNSAGTAYGTEYFFTTRKTVTVPVVTTMPIADIELTTASCGGIISDNGGDSIVRCGICWDVNPDPTTSSAGKVVMNYSEQVFQCNLSDLKHSTKYYVRSFAVNPKGVAYGENITFTTKILPEIAMASISGGTFQMGSYIGPSNEAPMHWVTLDAFKIGIKEVTVELWNAVMPNSENRNLQNNKPVSNVSMNDAMTFIYRLGLATNKNYRLPTEAEWEFVAGEGVGSRTMYATGLNDTAAFAERAWYLGNADGDVHPVGTLQPNKLGVYDLGGNVLEWCNDWYGDYSASDVVNPKGAASGPKKVLRGGSFLDPASVCRTSLRQSMEPNKRNPTTGFRIALTE